MISKRLEDFIVLGAVAAAVATGVYACGGDDSSGATSGGGDAATDGTGGGDDSDAQAGKDGGGADGSVACLGGNCANVLTEHNDNARTGQFTAETKLNPTNVTMASFGKLFELSVDGKIDAEPLFVQNVAIAGGTHNVLYVVTEHDSIYAFDAETKPDAGTSTLWGPISALGAGEQPSDDRGCSQVTPEIGITSTPVIDAATGTMYLIAMSKNGAAYHHRLHAIDITTGAEKPGSPKEITAAYPGSTTQEGDGGMLSFQPEQHKERSALLLDHGQIWTSWSSHCDHNPYTGWIMTYDPATLAQTAVFNDEPNSSAAEAAFWSSGGGPIADTAGNVYHETGNGGFETTLGSTGFPNQSDYGNSFIKLSKSGASISLVDYFAEYNEVAESAVDQDLSSGGPMLLPDSVGSAAHPHLLVGSGKDGHMYLLDQNNLGKFNADGGSNGQIVQDVLNATGTGASQTGSFGAPAYFNGAIYYGGVSQPLKRWAIANGAITTPQTSKSATNYQYPGTTPSISYNGTDPTTAIVWAHENGSPPALHAYSAADLATEYYNSNQAPGGRDKPVGDGNKFIVPMIANGHVYLATQNSIVVYGLL